MNLTPGVYPIGSYEVRFRTSCTASIRESIDKSDESEKSDKSLLTIPGGILSVSGCMSSGAVLCNFRDGLRPLMRV